MKNLVNFNNVEDRVLCLRNQFVLLNHDVAEIYGVETREINQAVKNNPEKFPTGYVFDLTQEEKTEVIKIFDNPKVKFSPTVPSAFTEKGLYMLATILKSPTATEKTIEIIETFTKFRELGRTVSELSETTDKPRQKSLMQRSGEILSSLIDEGMQVTGSETSLEINLAMVKIKHTVKQERKN
jgi:ribosomal protein L23